MGARPAFLSRQIGAEGARRASARSPRPNVRFRKPSGSWTDRRKSPAYNPLLCRPGVRRDGARSRR